MMMMMGRSIEMEATASNDPHHNEDDEQAEGGGAGGQEEDDDDEHRAILGMSWRLSMNMSFEKGPRLCERVLSSLSCSRGGGGGRRRCSGGGSGSCASWRHNVEVENQLVYLDDDNDEEEEDGENSSGRHLLVEEEEEDNGIVRSGCSTCSDTSSLTVLRRRRSSSNDTAVRDGDEDVGSRGGFLFPPSSPHIHTPSPPLYHSGKLFLCGSARPHLSELELMKERFAKLLLGEDMSGGAKGVSSALAISNAITNLSASVFGEMWRLEPLCAERKRLWRREMEWLLAVADHMVELIPSSQPFPDGHGDLEVMVSRPRPDLQIYLPALRKLDVMLLETLETFKVPTEFWYINQDNGMSDHEDVLLTPLLHREKEKWWLPPPRVPPTGLSNATIKHLRIQRECVNQILKATLSINNQSLSEMEVPSVYWENLPKTWKASVGDHLYKHITSQPFVPEAILHALGLTSEHEALEVVNRLEEAIHVCRQKREQKSRSPDRRMPRRSLSCGSTSYYHHHLMSIFDARPLWRSRVRAFALLDFDRRERLASRAEILLITLHRHFPNLPQSLLDRLKIQYNKDVGQSILESYSRVLESLASNIIARIDDVLHVDVLTRTRLAPK